LEEEVFGGGDEENEKIGCGTGEFGPVKDERFSLERVDEGISDAMISIGGCAFLFLLLSFITWAVLGIQIFI
jgi:hypothetical protein